MNNPWYKFYKFVLMGPFLLLWNRPIYIGAENIPEEGRGILASNHLAVMDSLYFPLLCKRQLTFLAKQEYFTTPGFVGRIQKFFFTSVNQVPINRTSSDASADALRAGLKVLERDDLLGMYPEGTRSPDGRLYRGKTGVARVALESGVDIIPVAMINTNKANPIGSWILRPKRIAAVVGKPIQVAPYLAIGDTRTAARALTDRLMLEIQKLSGQDYVDAYAADAKALEAEGKPLPPTDRPGEGNSLGL